MDIEMFLLGTKFAIIFKLLLPVLTFLILFFILIMLGSINKNLKLLIYEDDDENISVNQK